MLGQHYAEQRGIDPANIFHVSVTAGCFVTWAEFRRLRDQIILFMQNNTIGGLEPEICAASDPPHCCPESVDQLRRSGRAVRVLGAARPIRTELSRHGHRIPMVLSA